MARRPNKICPGLQCEIDAAVELLLGKPTRYSVYITKTRGGRVNFNNETLTVPLWAYEKGTDYFLYYVAHELTHTFGIHGHGPDFMAKFKEICPPEFWHYEIGYKPRNAMAAGITKPKTVA